MIKGKINNIWCIVKSIQDKQMYLFYLIFWIMGRVYILANNYYHVKIFHSIGLHFDIICLLSYIIHSQKQYRLFWIPFLGHELIGFVTFIFAQLKMDNHQNSLLWESGLTNSAISKISNHLGTFQDLFTPLYILIVITVSYRWRGERSKQM